MFTRFVLALALALGISGAVSAQRTPPPFVSPTDILVAGETSGAPPGLTWFVFDVSGPRTGEPDLLVYNRATGLTVLAITDHPQFSGLDGVTSAPGDCLVATTLPPNRDLVVADLDRDGAPDLFTYDPVTGDITRYYFRALGRCDWTDAF